MDSFIDLMHSFVSAVQAALVSAGPAESQGPLHMRPHMHLISHPQLAPP